VPRPSSVSLTWSERLLQRQRTIVIVALTCLILMAWLYVLSGSGMDMNPVDMTTWRIPALSSVEIPIDSDTVPAWSVWTWTLVVLMWWIMMIAMMTPGAAPMVLLFARVLRHGPGRELARNTATAIPLFVLGYLAIWLAFSIAVSVIQWALVYTGFVSEMMMWSTNAHLSGGILIAAGVYQLTPLKTACLAHCRNPVQFLAENWRNGAMGAFCMGIVHGTFCLGCCLFLMLLLFVGGVMNIVWIAGLTVYVSLEKLTTWGMKFARAAAYGLVGLGVVLLVVRR
jgi:predicted metal-binding membrane protein